MGTWDDDLSYIDSIEEVVSWPRVLSSNPSKGNGFGSLLLQEEEEEKIGL